MTPLSFHLMSAFQLYTCDSVTSVYIVILSILYRPREKNNNIKNIKNLVRYIKFEPVTSVDIN